MSNTVFVLGAGASREAGAPLMADFLNTSEQLWKATKVGDKARYFERVFKIVGSLQQVHSKSTLDLDNIESIFTTLEMAMVLRRLPGFQANEIEDCIASLKEVIVKTLELTIAFPVQEGRYLRPPRPYEEFMELIKYLRDEALPRHELSIITFNYDLAADFAMHMHAIGPNYCLSGSATSGIPLLKLHGSLNWAFCKSCKKIVPWTLSDFFKKYHWPMLSHSTSVNIDISSKLNNFIHCAGVAVDAEPVLVPPTGNKVNYHSELTDVWSAAAEKLSRADNIFIIGYSLPQTDIFFRSLYALGTVGENPLKRVWVYNPDVNIAIKKRFEDLMGTGAVSRFRYIEKAFSSAIPDIKKEFS